MAVRGQAQRGRRRPRRNMKKKSPTNKTLNKKIKHIENNLMEIKFIDLFTNPVTPTLAGYSDYISGVAQGDTASTREGNIINPTSFQFRGVMQADIDAGVLAQLRIIVFWDRQPNGAAPVLTGASTTQSLLDTGVITNLILSPRNFNTIDRHTILYDKVHTLNPQVPLTVVAGGTTQVASMGKFIKFRLDLSRLVKFNNTSAAITASVSNALHVAFFTEDNTDPPLIAVGYRMYYRDA